MMRSILFIIVGFLLFFSSCEKEGYDKRTELLSEIIYGDWELRESIDALVYQDEEYHAVQEPYPEFSFFENDSFLVLAPFLGKWDTFEHGLFQVNDLDSILTLHYTDWSIHSFNKDTLDIRIGTREGQSGRKLFKVE